MASGTETTACGGRTAGVRLGSRLLPQANPGDGEVCREVLTPPAGVYLCTSEDARSVKGNVSFGRRGGMDRAGDGEQFLFSVSGFPYHVGKGVLLKSRRGLSP